MPSQALPVGQSLLKLGVGFSSLLPAVCPSAIAAPLSKTNQTLPSATEKTLSQALLSDLLLSKPSSARHVPIFRPLQPLLDQEIEGREIETITARLISTSATTKNRHRIKTQDQLCQSLQLCDRSITITIDASSATTLSEPSQANHHLELSTLPLAPPTYHPAISEASTDPVLPSLAEMGLTALASAVAPEEKEASALLGLTTSIQPPNSERLVQALPQSTAEATEPKTIPKTIEIAQENTVQETAQENTEAADGLDGLLEASPSNNRSPQSDDELGVIRAVPLRSRGDSDLGILRLLQTKSAPPPPKEYSAFLIGRLGYINSDNAFRLDSRRSEQIYQSGLSFAAFPKLSKNTSLYAIAETNLGRFERESRRGYNEVELQVGVRQKILPRTYAQIGWRNQRFFSFGYDRQILGINYIDTRLSHRAILNNRTWLDSFYQARLGFADSKRSSRFRQTVTLSLNHSITKDFRTSLLYQLDLEDYTEISRYDVYQQVIGTISYRVTPESRITLFGGTRFGNSSSSDPSLSQINLDDTFYGAGLSVNLPLF